VGFVSTPPGRPGARFELSRFYITCCVADAVPVGVLVATPGERRDRLHRDDWLDVTGALIRGKREWIVRAARVAHVDAPSDPYIWFST
jgi:putative membrane protein